MDSESGAPAIQKLRDYLAAMPAGPVAPPDDVVGLLAACWGAFKGGGAEGMTASKLYGRVAGLAWQFPVLRFEIERHGGTVQGSMRAERHEWRVDLDAMMANCAVVGHRQLRPMQPRLDVRPIAAEISQAITERREDDRLTWNRDGSVRVLIGKILPARSAATRTLEGRRRRLRDALDERMRSAGWLKLRTSVYGPRRP